MLETAAPRLPSSAWEALRDKCYWMGLDHYVPNRALAGTEQADLVVIGGGFTGLWCAYQALKRMPGQREFAPSVPAAESLC